MMERKANTNLCTEEREITKGDPSYTGNHKKGHYILYSSTCHHKE